MIQKLKSYSLTLIALLTMAVPLMVPVAVSADCTNTGQQIANGANAAASSGTAINCDQGVDSSADNIKTLAGHIVNIFSIIVGIMAVIMIVYGGFRYITSGGESGSVSNAKNTLIYAIVGLIIVALAQVLVHFVLTTTSQVQ